MYFCKYSKFMNDLLNPENNVEKNSEQNRQVSQRGIYVREDDQDWGSSVMNDIQTAYE